jgi:CubicO group peptidase (beta-lactamase class C family)
MESDLAASVGVDLSRLSFLARSLQRDVDTGLCDGGVIMVSRHGKVVLHEAIGMTDRARGRAARKDDVFPIMSLTKSLVATVLLACIERGEFRLTSAVADVIPEFAKLGKGRITVAQVLGHMGGLPSVPTVPLDQWGDLDKVMESLSNSAPAATPGETISYSSFAAGYIAGELVRRVDPRQRALRDILREELFVPLSMHDTSLGQRKDLEPRRVPIVFRDKHEGRHAPETIEKFNEVFGEGSEIPSAGCYSTAADYHKFALMLLSHGEGGGRYFLSPLTLKLATSIFTGDLPNLGFFLYRETRGWTPSPANLGLGFYVRGEGIYPTYFGTLNSPQAFGHPGLGSTWFWVDPTHKMVFVALTAGLMEESRSMERFQRLSDIALSSVVRP